MKKATPSYRRFARLLPVLLALASISACTERGGIDDEVPPERSIYARLAVLTGISPSSSGFWPLDAFFYRL
jgi:hypothetical protein